MTRESKDLEARIRAAYDGVDLHPTQAALDRITQSRARATTGPSGRKWWAIVAAATAAGLALVVPVMKWRSDTPIPVVGALAEATLPPSLLAQGSERPAYPVVEIGRKEVPNGEWVWAFLPRTDTLTDSTPRQYIRVERTGYKGGTALLALGQRKVVGSAVSWGDSTWRDPGTLDILARSYNVSGGRQTEEFREGEVLTGYTSNGATTWRVIPTDTVDTKNAGVMLPNDIFSLALAKAPLAADWKGSIQLIGSTGYGIALRRWFDLTVVGEETITVPAGTYDCWKVAFGTSRIRGIGLFFWVSKDRQWLIQQAIEGEKFGKFRRVLVSGREE